MAYEFLHKFLLTEYKNCKLDDKDYKFPKAQLYQMYYAINRLDAEKFAKLDFTMNFGVMPEVRSTFVEMIENGGGYGECCKKVFEPTERIQLLKILKYLNWADKKMHSVFFLEDKDKITDDMLADFKEGKATTGVQSNAANTKTESKPQ